MHNDTYVEYFGMEKQRVTKTISKKHKVLIIVIFSLAIIVLSLNVIALFT